MRASVVLRGSCRSALAVRYLNSLFGHKPRENGWYLLAGAPKTGSAVRYGISCSALYEVFCRLLGSERDEAKKADIHTCVLRLLTTESHFAGVSCNPICFFFCVLLKTLVTGYSCLQGYRAH